MPLFSLLPCGGGGRLRLPCEGLLGSSRLSLLPGAAGGRLWAALQGIVKMRPLTPSVLARREFC